MRISDWSSDVCSSDLHAPVVLSDDRTTLQFHLARGNALTHHLGGAIALAVVQGPDAYVSASWYAEADQVPTWNYVAIEMEGVVRKLDDAELVAQLDRSEERSCRERVCQ